MDRANVRFASGCGGEWSIRPRQCVAFGKCCATPRSNRTLAIATPHRSHARALHTRAISGAR
eukprot:6622073-Lingulodinium_polyedra.AAC.1